MALGNIQQSLDRFDGMHTVKLANSDLLVLAFTTRFANADIQG